MAWLVCKEREREKRPVVDIVSVSIKLKMMRSRKLLFRKFSGKCRATEIQKIVHVDLWGLSSLQTSDHLGSKFQNVFLYVRTCYAILLLFIMLFFFSPCITKLPGRLPEIKSVLIFMLDDQTSIFKQLLSIWSLNYAFAITNSKSSKSPHNKILWLSVS